MPAEGAGTIWNPQLRGGQSYAGESDDKGEILDFNIVTFNSGGTGARPNKDGLSATAFPSGVRTMPVEATENAAPVLFRRKEYRPDSGGAGRWRGGLGQVMEIEGKDQQPFNVLAMFDRVHHPPKDVPAERKEPRVGQPGFRQETPCQRRTNHSPGRPAQTGTARRRRIRKSIPVNRNSSRKISRMV